MKTRAAARRRRDRVPLAGFLLAGALSAALAAPADAAPAKPIHFRRMALEEGLSQTTVNSILQDRRGFLWIATEDGLNRYDGYEFAIYRTDPADPLSLPADSVWALAEDAQGNLWVGTEGGGVARWDPRTDLFDRIELGSDPAMKVARALRIDAAGTVWIGTREAGLVRLDPATGAVTSYRHRAGDGQTLANDAVYVIAPSRDGSLWVGTDDGVDRFDPRSGHFTHVGQGAEAPALADGRVRGLHEDRHGVLWIGTYGGGLARFDPSSGKLESFRHDPDDPRSLPHDRVRAVLEDDAGRLWVGTAGALAIFDQRSRTFQAYRHERADPGSLSDDDVLALFQDRGGVLWVGTRSGGINRWHPKSWLFGHHATGEGALSDGTVTSFAERGGDTLWIGTLGGGLHRLDRSSGTMRYFRHDPRDPTSLSSDRVSALLVDGAGTLWVGTLDRGLNRLGADGTSFRTYRHDPADDGSLGAEGVTSLLEDQRGGLWVGTFGGGLHRYQPETDSFLRYTPDPEDETSLSSPRVTCLAEDGFGALWVGTDGGGLARLDRASGSFRHYRHRPDDPRSLGADTVFALHAAPSGVLWVGTRAGGVTRLEARPDALDRPDIRRYTRSDGLPNEVIYGIEPDDEGRLWLSTNNGLATLDPRDGSVRTWDVTHGLQANEFTFGAHFRGASGELFFGGIDGFNAFFPHRLRHSETAPPLQLTRILKLNRPATELGSSWALPRLRLDHRDDVVTFELAALDFAAPERNRYAYQLEGFDSGWIELGRHRRVTYTDLDAGRYVFRARGANHDGVWSEPVSLEVHVASAPWRTWWAYAAYASLAALGVAGLVRGQRRKLVQEEAYSHRLELEVRERTAELAVRNHDLERLNNELAEASLTDSLTGLRNRRFLFEQIGKEVSLVERRYTRLGEGVEPIRRFDLVFVMIDLDHFKSINDTCGHQAGDQVLVQLRQVLESICRASDLVIRWGGDEILVVGRDSSPDEAESLAQRIGDAVREHVFTIDQGRVVRITCSIGYACLPFLRRSPRTFSWEEVLALADAALYAVKKSGRDGWAGVVGNERTPGELLQLLRHHPQRVVAEGLVTIRTSLAREAELVWA
jgi:diguanylate cyclase (GGDEF)-like protein